ncbi:MAG: cysteine hydrolase family protein [Candidatus Woesearchaeota archaeon]
MKSEQYTNKKIIFWNVDTAYDFMRNDADHKGALYVSGAESIEQNLEKLTSIAEDQDLKVINTADWHTMNDLEISLNPDFKKTYPPHCMKETKGAQYISATNPKNPYIIDWQNGILDESRILSSRNIVLYKNDFNAFKGNSYTSKVLDIVTNKNDVIFVYGVATNVCVNYAVEELVKRNREVYVISDAVKELPAEIAEIPLEKILNSWQEKGVKFIKTKDIPRFLENNYQAKKIVGEYDSITSIDVY